MAQKLGTLSGCMALLCASCLLGNRRSLEKARLISSPTHWHRPPQEGNMLWGALAGAETFSRICYCIDVFPDINQTPPGQPKGICDITHANRQLTTNLHEHSGPFVQSVKFFDDAVPYEKKTNGKVRFTNG